MFGRNECYRQRRLDIQSLKGSHGLEFESCVAPRDRGMTVDGLKRSFPGLFGPAGCVNQSEAERCADAVASQSGLTIRAGSWVGDNGNRHIEYRNREGTLKLQVELLRESADRSKTPSWLFSFSGERLDANLLVKTAHDVEVKPSSFQRAAKGMIADLRSLKVGSGGRIVGRVKKWDSAKGRGLIECIPGASVLIESGELPMGVALRYNERVSFRIERSAGKQRAVEVRRGNEIS
jgi:cold shock CspA family protein